MLCNLTGNEMVCYTSRSNNELREGLLLLFFWDPKLLSGLYQISENKPFNVLN